jgi:hypothetical protein
VLTSVAVANEVTLCKIQNNECVEVAIDRKDLDYVYNFAMEGLNVGSCSEKGYTVKDSTQNMDIPFLHKSLMLTHMRRSALDVLALKAQAWLSAPFLWAKSPTASKPVAPNPAQMAALRGHGKHGKPLRHHPDTLVDDFVPGPEPTILEEAKFEIERLKAALYKARKAAGVSDSNAVVGSAGILEQFMADELATFKDQVESVDDGSKDKDTRFSVKDLLDTEFSSDNGDFISHDSSFDDEFDFDNDFDMDDDDDEQKAEEAHKGVELFANAQKSVQRASNGVANKKNLAPKDGSYCARIPSGLLEEVEGLISPANFHLDAKTRVLCCEEHDDPEALGQCLVDLDAMTNMDTYSRVGHVMQLDLQWAWQDRDIFVR